MDRPLVCSGAEVHVQYELGMESYTISRVLQVAVGNPMVDSLGV